MPTSSSAIGAAPTGFTFQEFLSVLVRRWWLVILLAAAGAAVAYWYDRHQVLQYTAHALVQRQGKATAEALGLPGYNTDPLDLASEMQILRSRAVVAEAVDSGGLRARFSDGLLRDRVFDDVNVAPQAPAGRYQLQGDRREVRLTTTDGRLIARAAAGQVLEGPGFRLRVAEHPLVITQESFVTIQSREDAIKSVQGAVTPDNDVGATLIRLRLRDIDPVYAARVLNEVAAAYVRHDGRRARDEAKRRADLVERQLAEVRDSLSLARDALLGYQAQHGSVDADQFAAKLETLEDQYNATRAQVAVLDGIAASLRSNAPVDDAFRRVLLEASSFLPTGEALYTDLRKLQQDRQKLTAPRFGYTDGDSRVQALDSLIADTRNELLAITDQAVKLRRLQIETGRQRIATLRAQLAVIPEQNATSAQYAQRVAAVQKTFDQLADKNYEAHIASESASGQAEVVDPAVAPRDADPSRTGTLLLGVLMGLFSGVGVAFIIENMDSSVRRLGDVERVTGLRVLALIPRAVTRRSGLRRRRSVGIIVEQRGVEAFRLLRTALRFIRDDKNRLMAVTSARPKEGKSTVASNLGVAYARQSQRVLLIDADLRRPTLHNLLQQTRGIGLTDVLAGRASLEEAARKTRYDGLYLLSCGTMAPNPAELLGSDDFKQLLERCRASFEIVIVDTPPVLAVADAALVGAVVDGMIVVARAGETNRHALAHAASELARFNVPPIGVVLNAAPTARVYGRYMGYSGYYHFEAYNDYYMDAPSTDGKPAKRSRRSRSVG